MIDLELLRKNPEIFKNEVKKRGMKIDVDGDLAIDSRRRSLIFKVDELRAQKNEASKKIPLLSGEEKQKMIKEMKKVNKELSELETRMNEAEKLFFERVASYPNITHPSVPSGRNENDNVVMYMVGEKPDFDFEPRNHIELGKNLEIIDEDRAAKVSGARFIFLKNEAVLLQFALVRYVMDFLVGKGLYLLFHLFLLKNGLCSGQDFFLWKPHNIIKLNLMNYSWLEHLKFRYVHIIRMKYLMLMNYL